ncbi:MAG: DUF58 domain-containing protein [Gemmatimonadota bacterium]
MALWPFRQAPAEPNGCTLSGEDAAAMVRKLEIRARRLMDSPMLGRYDSLFRGHGIEFAEVRKYEPGDPFQAIDWKVTARMGRPFVKRFVEERELTVLLLLDVSRSTNFGSRTRTKLELGIEVASVLAFVAGRKNDQVGLILFSDRVERLVEPARGQHHLRRLLYEMVTSKPEGSATDLGVALTTASRHLRRRSLVFVLSDFQGPAFERPLSALARRHEVVAVHLEDPAESELPATSLVEFMDPETGVRDVLDLRSPRVRDAFAQRRAAESDDLRRVLRKAGCDHLLLRTEEPWVPNLFTFLAARSRRRRAG